MFTTPAPPRGLSRFSFHLLSESWRPGSRSLTSSNHNLCGLTVVATSASLLSFSSQARLLFELPMYVTGIIGKSSGLLVYISLPLTVPFSLIPLRLTKLSSTKFSTKMGSIVNALGIIGAAKSVPAVVALTAPKPYHPPHPIKSIKKYAFLVNHSFLMAFIPRRTWDIGRSPLKSPRALMNHHTV